MMLSAKEVGYSPRRPTRLLLPSIRRPIGVLYPGDEVIHERDHPAIPAGDVAVEGRSAWKVAVPVPSLLWSYDYVGDSTRWYRREVRIVRRDPCDRFVSRRTGVFGNWRPLWVKPVDAVVHHYGWVKPPEQQQAKQRSFHALWHSDEWVRDRVGTNSTFDYSGIDSWHRSKGAIRRLSANVSNAKTGRSISIPAVAGYRSNQNSNCG